MKKGIVLITTLLLLIGLLSGCVSTGGGKNVTLVVWGDPDNQAILEDCFEALNAEFAKQHPDIKIDYQWSGSFDGLNVAMQSDSLPDLFWVQGNKSSAMAEMAENGFLLPLDKYNPDKSRFPAGAIEYATVNGKIYCSFPSFIDYALVYYNKDIFAEHGLEKPKTYDEFVNAAKTLFEAGITPFSLGGDFEWSRYWPIQVMAATLANNDLERIKSGETTGEFPEIEYVFEQFRDMCAKGYFGTPAGAMDESSAQMAFTNGTVAMIFEGTWNNSLFRDLDFEVGRFALPDNNGVRAAQSGYSNFNTYAISSKCKYPDQAYEYIDFLNSKEAQQIVADYMKSIPAVEGITVDDPALAEVSDFQTVNNNIYHVLSNVPTKSGRPQDVFISSVVADLMTNSITAKEAVNKIVEEMNR
ncbi:MAG TPA: extracellular solute-binding protein [Clostridiales bacterium]|nr:extracellular solute-binding protein [Clostridiales bacterium]